MKRLIAPLLLLAGLGIALAVTSGGDVEAPGRPVPELTVARLDGSGDFALARLSATETPTLLWFWAPWCEICNHEAPAIERLATEARDELAVVAIGGRDDAANGPAFVERHGLRTPTILFDEPMAVWQAYAIPGQPAGVLLDRDGREQARWLGAFDPTAVAAAARSL
ncbi:MAG TPA: TlpA disulfide reductase family protein [Solirubrobacteraceae bacterium]|nr:TlpA disulfide reductase family protein [Solirubrobacteraceae bacterium]